MVDKESLNLLFDLEVQAIGLLVLIVPFLALYYRNFLHWKNAPGHYHRDSPLKSPGELAATFLLARPSACLPAAVRVPDDWQSSPSWQ